MGEAVLAALVGIACIGGLPGVHMGIAGTTTGQKQIRIIKRTPGSLPGHTGATGTSQESRNIGAEAGKIIQ